MIRVFKGQMPQNFTEIKEDPRIKNIRLLGEKEEARMRANIFTALENSEINAITDFINRGAE